MMKKFQFVDCATRPIFNNVAVGYNYLLGAFSQYYQSLFYLCSNFIPQIAKIWINEQ
ncbi:unnamed protein product [Paramecium primaurelia]|uniref:Uncharacterized protein n=1 Tax=Paramecium primaurelia TaxID=5886 RepID=A0A8S1L0C9_PARPR|nr:unnamed protein product [Paramecium primaurelia]